MKLTGFPDSPNSSCFLIQKPYSNEKLFSHDDQDRPSGMAMASENRSQIKITAAQFQDGCDASLIIAEAET